MVAAPIPDRTITQQVQNRLASRGLSAPCRVLVATAKGLVTLSGTVRHEHQKTSAVQVAGAVSGVKRVIDRLIIKEAVKY